MCFAFQRSAALPLTLRSNRLTLAEAQPDTATAAGCSEARLNVFADLDDLWIPNISLTQTS